MDQRHLLQTLAVVLLLFSAGCSGLPFTGSAGQQGPVTLDLDNAADDTYTFDVWVVETPASVTSHRGDGTTSQFQVGVAGISTFYPGDYQTIERVEPPESARHHTREELAPGERNRTEIHELPERFAVLVVVSQDDRVASIVDSTCTDGDFVYLNVTMRNYGTDTSRPSC